MKIGRFVMRSDCSFSRIATRVCTVALVLLAFAVSLAAPAGAQHAEPAAAAQAHGQGEAATPAHGEG